MSLLCKKSYKKTGAYNRAIKNNAPIFCGRTCFGLYRRKHLSESEKKELKRLYDIQYRAKNSERIKKEKAEYFRKTYDPEKSKIERKKRSAQHAEYCRRPEYVKWKKEYDRKYKAKKAYGEYWESAVLLNDINTEILPEKYEVKLETGLLNKSQRRKRNEKVNSK